MCVFSSPKAPPPVSIPDAPPPVEQPAAAPQASDPSIQQSRLDARRRKLAASGANDTLVTGGAGIAAPAATALKTSFGQ